MLFQTVSARVMKKAWRMDLEGRISHETMKRAGFTSEICDWSAQEPFGCRVRNWPLDPSRMITSSAVGQHVKGPLKLIDWRSCSLMSPRTVKDGRCNQPRLFCCGN